MTDEKKNERPVDQLKKFLVVFVGYDISWNQRYHGYGLLI